MSTKDKSILHLVHTNEPMVDMARTIASWLVYNSSVCGKIGVQENMIDYPIKSFLVYHQNEWQKATFEETHPYLKSRRIDFHYEDKNAKYYVEFKQAKEDTEGLSEIQRVFNDLVRLSICKKKDANDRCYFLMFGDIESYKNFFINGQTSDMSYSDCFCFSLREKGREKVFFPTSANIKKSDKSSKNSLMQFFSDKYKSRNDGESVEVLVPDEVIVKLVWTNYDSIENPLNIVGLWEILLESSDDKTVDSELKEMDTASFLDVSIGG